MYDFNNEISNSVFEMEQVSCDPNQGCCNHLSLTSAVQLILVHSNPRFNWLKKTKFWQFTKIPFGTVWLQFKMLITPFDEQHKHLIPLYILFYEQNLSPQLVTLFYSLHNFTGKLKYTQQFTSNSYSLARANRPLNVIMTPLKSCITFKFY